MIKATHTQVWQVVQHLLVAPVAEILLAVQTDEQLALLVQIELDVGAVNLARQSMRLPVLFRPLKDPPSVVDDSHDAVLFLVDAQSSVLDFLLFPLLVNRIWMQHLRVIVFNLVPIMLVKPQAHAPVLLPKCQYFFIVCVWLIGQQRVDLLKISMVVSAGHLEIIKEAR